MFSFRKAVIITALRAVFLWLFFSAVAVTVDVLWLIPPLGIAFSAAALILIVYYSSHRAAVKNSITVSKGIFVRRTYSIKKEDVRAVKYRKTPLEYIFGTCKITLFMKGFKITLPFSDKTIMELVK